MRRWGRVIDFHTHILPKVDDGSRTVEESLLMLQTLAEQGVKTVIATPHFYANDESVDSFLERRNKAYEVLKEKAGNAPDIVLGAEVKYYDGISHLQDLKKLRVEGTRFLLLEMPFSRWTDYSVREIVDIASRGKITLVLAHIERYLPFTKKETIEYLGRNGVLFQVNASFFQGVFNTSKAVKMLREGRIQFIGSDCHNTADRAPHSGKALGTIEKKLGSDAVLEYISFGNELFLQNQLS